MINKIPCGGFYYDDSKFMFAKNKQGYPVLKSRPIFEKINDWLYLVDYDYYSYGEAEEYLNKYHPYPIAMSCSEIRVGDIVGRNFDWYYGNEVQMIVNTKAVNGRHATMGVTHTKLTKEQVENDGEWNYYYDILPFLINDCINDKGVYCGINVTPLGDKGRTTGTNPEADKSISQLMLPRYIGDYADTAKDAITLLENANVYASFGNMDLECHVLICDGVDSYIVEFVNNEIVVMSDTDDDYDTIPNDKVIMTNFYLDGWDGNIKAVFMGDTEQEVKATGLTDHANGLERYNILSAGYDAVSDMDDMGALMEDVKFTLAYNENQNPFWYSEFLGGDYTIYNTQEELADVKSQAIEEYEHRTRDNKTWYTSHTSVYDIDKKQLDVYVNEDYANKYQFKLHVIGALD